MRKSVLRGIALLLVMCSGALGAGYQVMWERLLRLNFGADDITTTLVTSTFLLGLGLGAALFSRTFRRPLLIYAGVETAIGLFALISYPYLHGLSKALRVHFGANLSNLEGLHAVTVCGVLLVLALPSALIGGTLPLIFASFADLFEVEARAVGRLYGANTLGAMVGIVAAPFLLFNTFLVPQALTFCASLNFVLACCLGIFHYRFPVPEASSNDTVCGASRANFELLGASFLSGAAVLCFELIALRHLGVLRSGSPYNFVLVLFPYLGALAIGSFLLGSKAPRQGKSKAQLTSRLFVLAAFGAVTSLVSCSWLLKSGFLSRGTVTLTASSGSIFRTLVYSCLLVVPFGVLQGGIFPRLLTTSGASGENSGDLPLRTGPLYLASALGSFTSGLLVHFLGFEILGTRGVLLLLVLTAAWGSWLVLEPSQRKLVGLWHQAAGIVLVLLLLTASSQQTWQRIIYAWPALARAPALLEGIEGQTGTASIVWKTPERSQGVLIVSGKAFSTLPYSATWLYAATWALARPRKKEALLIGLGGGTVICALTEDSAVEHVDVVDWSSELPHLLRKVDERIHVNGCLDSSKVRLLRGDARTAVHLADTQGYDLVVESLTSYGPVGSTHYRSLEYYEQMRRILRDSGVLVTIGLHRGDLPVVAAMLRHFSQVRWVEPYIALTGSTPLFEEHLLDQGLRERADRLGSEAPRSAATALATTVLYAPEDVSTIVPVTDDRLFGEYRIRPW